MSTHIIPCLKYITFESLFKIKTTYTDMIENTFQKMKDEKCVPKAVLRTTY